MRAVWQGTALWLVLWLASIGGVFAGDCKPSVGHLVSLQGTVEARGPEQANWHPAKLNESFCPGDAIRTAARSRAALVLSNETIVRLDQLTTLTLSGLDNTDTSWVNLLQGMAHFLSRTPRALKIRTPYVDAGIEGTEFVVRAGPDEGSVTVIEGRVRADNSHGSIPLASGETAVAQDGQAPAARLGIQAQNTVRWALYYPPLFDHAPFTQERGSDADAVRRSIAAYESGDLTAAFAALAGVPASAMDARFLEYRAGLLLVVGRLDEAQQDLTRALTLAPDSANALAVQAVMELVGGDRSLALKLAHTATERSANSVPAWMALSYAQQAAFDLDGARASAERALAREPDSALVLARLAELWLSLGDLDRALDAAQRAATLQPNSARTQTVLGFAHLTRLRVTEARQAFERAIALDSVDPLARLGLGLAMIRTGNLEAGRREIEIAAALDPNNSLIRSYLGKAYYEEKRNRLAATQLNLARQMDPSDPTPWFYDALRKQTENRPVEALNDLQKSIELNSNRAVYRSRLLLDEDQAARSASLARIYDDLGFQQLALVEGWKSVNTDPGNYSAHRFLADSYATLPRHEIARVSELLQAQLLQPLNLTPVQPRLAESRFNAPGGGPASSAFNEYNPLFVREGVALLADGLGGSHGTWGDELTLSGLHGPVSWSIGQLHYQTDGTRPNADYTQKLYNVFGQVALSPTASLQVEVRSNDIEHGDIAQRLKSVMYPDDRYDRQTGTARLGYHQQLQPGSDFLASVIFQRSQERQHLENRPDPDTLEVTELGAKPEGYLAEIQHLYRRPEYSITSGLGYFDANSSVRLSYEQTFLGFPIFGFATTIPADIRQTNGYLYTRFVPDRRTVWTLGLSYDDYQNGSFEKSQFNPKLGLLWNPVPDTTLRFAAFRTLKRALLSDQTLEPTQVAGFAQFFDDYDATDARRYGAAIDQRFGKTLWGGVELSHRDLRFISDFVTGTIEDASENLARFYVNWAIHPRWVFGAEYYLEGYARQLAPLDIDQPRELTTHRLPLALNYFHPDGWFGGLRLTPVIQKAQFGDGFGAYYSADDRFWLTDITMGYRLPARRGLISISVRNLFDQEFLYQDSNFQTNEPRLSAILPERNVLARLTLVF
jgi:tetratricopeptide (TPR) repeat protein